MSWFSAEVRAGEMVDLVVDERGREPRRYADAPIDAASGQIIHAVCADVLRKLPTCIVHVRAVVPGDSDRVCGEYFFHHTAAT